MDAYSREHVEDTAKLVTLVDEKTGYWVTVGTAETGAADAEMISATRSRAIGR